MELLVATLAHTTPGRDADGGRLNPSPKRAGRIQVCAPVYAHAEAVYQLASQPAGYAGKGESTEG